MDWNRGRERRGQFKQSAETHPPAFTLSVVRTGASVAELKTHAFQREPPSSKLSDRSSSSQQSKFLRLLNDFPVRIANLDFAKIQFPHVRFDLGAVPYCEYDGLLRLNVFLRRGLRLLCRHGVDAIR